jgi:hypothetical protein
MAMEKWKKDEALATSLPSFLRNPEPATCVSQF